MNDKENGFDSSMKITGYLKSLKNEVFALYLAYKDPRVPWYGKILAFLIIAYAFSPIDLIPDFIPVLGYLDDLIIIPVGILLVIKLIPDEVMEEHRKEVARQYIDPKTKAFGLAIVIVLWALILLGIAGYIWILCNGS